jgi:hypothetical protein
MADSIGQLMVMTFRIQLFPKKQEFLRCIGDAVSSWLIDLQCLFVPRSCVQRLEGAAEADIWLRGQLVMSVVRVHGLIYAGYLAAVLVKLDHYYSVLQDGANTIMSGDNGLQKGAKKYSLYSSPIFQVVVG